MIAWNPEIAPQAIVTHIIGHNAPWDVCQEIKAGWVMTGRETSNPKSPIPAPKTKRKLHR